jgi:hypothetical protein
MAAHVGDGERRAAPLTDLLGSLVTDVTLLARHEGELAIIELKGKATEVGIGVGVLACGALAAVFALATAIAAAVLGLAIVLPAWAAALIVAVALLAAAAALGVLGRARIRAAAPLVPTETLESVQEDIRWIRQQMDDLNQTMSG